MINKYYIIGGALVSAFIAYKVIAKPAPVTPQDTSQQSYSTGFGSNVISSGGLPSGSTSENSFAQLASAIGLKSQNDLTLGLALDNTTRSIGMASVNADLQTSLVNLGNSRLHDAYVNIPTLHKLGLSAIDAFTNSTTGHVGASLLYTDNSKNTALVKGKNASGDTLTTFDTINKMSSQSTYDIATYVDINGVKKNNLFPSTPNIQIAPVTPVAPVFVQDYSSHGAGYGDGQNTPAGFSGGYPSLRNNR